MLRSRNQASESTFLWQWCFFFHYYLATSTTIWAHFFTGFLQVCYFMLMLRYTKWEDLSLTITNSVRVFKKMRAYKSARDGHYFSWFQRWFCHKTILIINTKHVPVVINRFHKTSLLVSMYTLKWCIHKWLSSSKQQTDINKLSTIWHNS